MTKGLPFPYLQLSGSAYDLGYSHGFHLREQIEASLKTYKGLFKTEQGFTWKEAQQRAYSFLPAIQEYSPHLLEEMQGIADGCRCSLAEILALNARTELLLPDLPECTSLILADDSCHGEHLLAQNWDWVESQQEAIVVLQLERSNYPTLLMVTEAGIIGKIGMNEAGVGVCFNALSTAVRGFGLPLHLFLRLILERERVEEVPSMVATLPFAASGCVFVTQGSRESSMALEITPHFHDVIPLDEGVLVHTNHFIGPRGSSGTDAGKQVWPDTICRYQRATELLKENTAFGVERVKEVLRDHQGYPYSICRHKGKGGPGIQEIQTVFSIIMHGRERYLLLAEGPPCCMEYQRVHL